MTLKTTKTNAPTRSNRISGFWTLRLCALLLASLIITPHLHGQTNWFYPAKLVTFSDVTLAAGDANQDGFTDLLVRNSDELKPLTKLLLSNGDGTFSSGFIITNQYPAVPGFAGMIDLFDIKSDGKLDISDWNRQTQRHYAEIWLAEADHTFRLSQTIQIPYPILWIDKLSVNDVNGDHRPDLFVRQFNLGAAGPWYFLTVLTNGGSGLLTHWYNGPTDREREFVDLTSNEKTDVVDAARVFRDGRWMTDLLVHLDVFDGRAQVTTNRFVNGTPDVHGFKRLHWDNDGRIDLAVSTKGLQPMAKSWRRTVGNDLKLDHMLFTLCGLLRPLQLRLFKIGTPSCVTHAWSNRQQDRSANCSSEFIFSTRTVVRPAAVLPTI